MEQLNTGRSNGFLNEKNREFILNRWDSSGDSSRQRRYRIRKKFSAAFRDLYYLTLLPEGDRDRILSNIFVDEEDARAPRLSPDPEEPTDSGLSLLSGLFQELYRGLDTFAFEEALETGVEQAIVNQRVAEDGMYPDVKPELRIETTGFGEFDVKEMARRIRESDGGTIPWGIEHGHVKRLYKAGEITHQEYQYLRENTHRVMTDEQSEQYELYQEELELKAARTWRDYSSGWSVNDILLLRERDYLTNEEAEAILNGDEEGRRGEDDEGYIGFRRAVHYLACAYQSDDWNRHLPAQGRLPDSAADITIPASGWDILDDLQEWHKRTEGNPNKQQAERVQKGENTEEFPLMMSRCVDYESGDRTPSVSGEDLYFEVLRYNVPEPEYGFDEIPPREKLTPTHINALRDREIIGEDRYYELMRDVLEVAPSLVSDQTVRELFAAGEIDIKRVRSVLDVAEMEEEFIEQLHDNGRISDDQYYDMLEMKCRLEPRGLSRDTLLMLFESGRVDPFEINPTAQYYLFQQGLYTADEYVDALEAGYERNPSKLQQQDVLELYDAGRITAEEVAEHPNTAHTDPDEVHEHESLLEDFPEDYGEGVK